MIVYGRNIVLEALKSEHYVEEIFLQEDINESDKIESILSQAYKLNIDVTRKSRPELTKICKVDEHQGVAAKVNFQDYSLNKFLTSDKFSLDKSYIYISEATYEHNVGAIIRSAECAGFGGVIIPNSVEITSVVAKTSVGALFHIPIIREPIYQTIKSFKKLAFSVLGIERDGTIYTSADLKSPALFIIGSEDKSLSENIREECNLILEIPQKGNVNSLNMSVAASIVMFEHNRQRFS